MFNIGYFNENASSSNNLQFSFSSKTLYALALLYGLVRDDSLCSEYLSKVYNSFAAKLGEENLKTKKAKERLDLYKREQEEKQL